MLGFNQDEYLTSAREIIAARQKQNRLLTRFIRPGSVLYFSPLLAVHWRQ
ncbi:putative glucosamine-fructose-6-phosphate aminotransferase [Salmonella enterica subsp. enterica]|nr:putative glucosamine-fructose-6-phosphate aminotransferase [Salmonella enterica subsp. enterica]